MSRAAQTFVDRWRDGGEVDLDVECRRLAMQSLGRSVLGIDLERARRCHRRTHACRVLLHRRSRAPAGTCTAMATDPGTPPRARRGRAMREVTDEMLRACRADPTRDAPLVHALIAATDPETGQSLSDNDISNDLLIFMLAGHDTTATALAYSLWVLGHHPDVQDRVAAEAAAIGDRELTPEDVPRLGYTVQVLHEALRLCPPAAGVARLASRDIAVGGYRVEAGSLMAVGIYALHRDPALWDRPLVFDPGPVQPRRTPRAATAGNSSLPRRRAFVYRRTLCEAGNDSGAGHHRPGHRDPFVGQGFPVDVPFTTVAEGPIWARMSPRS